VGAPVLGAHVDGVEDPAGQLTGVLGPLVLPVVAHPPSSSQHAGVATVDLCTEKGVELAPDCGRFPERWPQPPLLYLGRLDQCPREAGQEAGAGGPRAHLG
jgi:hypothetical protein